MKIKAVIMYIQICSGLLKGKAHKSTKYDLKCIKPKIVYHFNLNQSVNMFFYPSRAIELMFLKCPRRGICGSFFLSLSFSHSEVVNKKSSNYNFVQNDKVFTQMMIFSLKLLGQKSCHLMTF